MNLSEKPTAVSRRLTNIILSLDDAIKYWAMYSYRYSRLNSKPALCVNHLATRILGNMRLQRNSPKHMIF